VLDLGLQPEIPLDQWELKLHGLVEQPVTLKWSDFMALPQFTDVSDFHCVTTWSQFDMPFTGVAFFTIADLVKPKPEATHVFFKSYDGYSTNNPLDACLDDDVLIAHSWNGRPLTKEWRSGPGHPPETLRLERREVCPRHCLPRPGHSRFLGGARLLEHG
jgi:DMSO/TMAO reductase YedYZ molybdopterin-dependent catalytic subunit